MTPKIFNGSLGVRWPRLRTAAVIAGGVSLVWASGALPTSATAAKADTPAVPVVTGSVLMPDGTPAVNAAVLVHYVPHVVTTPSYQEPLLATGMTDGSGHYTLPLHLSPEASQDAASNDQNINVQINSLLHSPPSVSGPTLAPVGSPAPDPSSSPSQGSPTDTLASAEPSSVNSTLSTTVPDPVGSAAGTVNSTGIFTGETYSTVIGAGSTLDLAENAATVNGQNPVVTLETAPTDTAQAVVDTYNQIAANPTAYAECAAGATCDSTANTCSTNEYYKCCAVWFVDATANDLEPVTEIHAWDDQTVSFQYQKEADSTFGVAVNEESHGFTISGSTTTTDSRSVQTGIKDPVGPYYGHQMDGEFQAFKEHRNGGCGYDAAVRIRLGDWTGGFATGLDVSSWDGPEGNGYGFKHQPSTNQSNYGSGFYTTRSSGKAYNYGGAISAFGVGLSGSSMYSSNMSITWWMGQKFANKGLNYHLFGHDGNEPTATNVYAY